MIDADGVTVFFALRPMCPYCGHEAVSPCDRCGTSFGAHDTVVREPANHSSHRRRNAFDMAEKGHYRMDMFSATFGGVKHYSNERERQ